SGAVVGSSSGDAGELLAQRGDELLGHRVGYVDALGDGDAVADLPQHEGHRDVEGGADGGEQLGGRLLLAALHLAEVAEGDTRGGGDLAQRAALVLPHRPKHVTDLAS